MDGYAGKCLVLISHSEIKLLWYLICPIGVLNYHLLFTAHLLAVYQSMQ
jgi:hypothetical protein